jgi:bifunctional pyridoxal-dependent enzyme with beta-cystathionase and maltose regulon repressor activities
LQCADAAFTSAPLRRELPPLDDRGLVEILRLDGQPDRAGQHLTAERLLTEYRLVVAPGEGFGPSGAGWARLSLAVTDETLELGLERLAHAFSAA